MGAAGRRRQFRADRRRNHPRPCPSLLSGSSGGLFSFSLSNSSLSPSVPRCSYHPTARGPLCRRRRLLRGAKSTGGHRPDPSGRELRVRACLSAAFGRARAAPATRQTSLSAASASAAAAAARRPGCSAIRRPMTRALGPYLANTCPNADATVSAVRHNLAGTRGIYTSYTWCVFPVMMSQDIRLIFTIKNH